MGKYRGLDTEEGWIQRRFTALERAVQELSAARRLGLVSEVRQVDVSPAALTNAYLEYGIIAVTPPVGYNVALVQMVALASASYPNNVGANIGIQPRAGSVTGTATSNSRPGNAVGGGPAVAVTASLAAKLTVVGGVPFNLRAAAYTDGAYDAGTANVRYSATIIYTRE